MAAMRSTIGRASQNARSAACSRRFEVRWTVRITLSIVDDPRCLAKLFDAACSMPRALIGLAGTRPMERDWWKR
jgi:hypothetical protein